MFNIKLLNFSIYESSERKQSHTCMQKIDKIDEKQEKEEKKIAKSMVIFIHKTCRSFLQVSFCCFFSLSHYV